jgi:tetratricopeptide (TPR) repeat protein
MCCCLPLLLSVTEAQSPTGVREADAVCAKCHQSIYQSYLKTPMANASGLAEERPKTGTFVHPASGIVYQIVDEAGTVSLNYRKLSDPAIAGKQRLDYFLGSGHLGLTYLYVKDNYLLESPVAYYPDLKGYDMKPGLENIRTLPGALQVDATCLHCHMSAVQQSEPGTDNRYQNLPFLHSGITCESCHGEASQHAASGGVGIVVNPLKLPAPERDSTCIVCHLEGTTSVARRDRSVLDYRPGQNISDYLAYYTKSGEKENHRGVSEIEQFLTSKCKRTSGDAMSCMNCHDPHRSPAAEDRAAFYREKCLACHTAPKYAKTHYTQNPDCTACHMPKNGVENLPHTAWTDHRILQTPNESPGSLPDAPGERGLVPILRASETPRDLGLAYYDLAVDGDRGARSTAETLLASAAKSAPDDTAVLQALAIIAGWDGDDARSTQLYLEVLKQQPDSFTSITNLGTLLAKSGRTEEAAKLWRPSFARNEDVLTLGENLASVECSLGNKDRAIAVLKRTLAFHPDTPQLRQMLTAIENGKRSCPADVAPLQLESPGSR